MIDDIDFDQAHATISRIAHLAAGFAGEAGVGGTETAGHIISYLATHPRDVEPFLRFGLNELPEGWMHHGDLTWQAGNGKVVHPRWFRRQRIIAKMKAGA